MPLFDEKMSAENGFFLIQICCNWPLLFWTTEVCSTYSESISLFFFLPRTVSRRKLEHLVGKSHERKEVPDNFSQGEIIGFLKQINYLGLFVCVERFNLDLPNACNSKLTHLTMKKKLQTKKWIILFTFWLNGSPSDWGGLQLFSAMFCWWINSSMNTFSIFLFYESW